ncbi:hypothetical protein CALVIDRAFT_539970 [Calocera viscosa TUFC12733]|uniref:Uncharacterized protein n=1 Tax=Calocera viscosa (strain TUFC12733) TaxID=1330018 RepID=A0A167JEP2_CALVF|nr:hypothetical protein CALVIDRAFT_539970 [Calocera viscosa TUFC12733]
MSTAPTLALLPAIPALILIPLLPLALAFVALALLYPRQPAQQDQRFSLLLPSEEKDRLAVPSGARPGSYASRHTTVRLWRSATRLSRAGLAIIAPAVTAGVSFGAGAVCAIAAAARQDADASALSRSAGVLNVLGVFFAGLTPILLLTPTSLNHIFPSCATLQPTLRISRTATPEPYWPRKRSSYRVGLLLIALLVSCLFTLVSSSLAPSLPIPSGALAAGPGTEMLALLLPLQSILHLSPHRPILIPALIAHFFGLVGRALSLARALEPADTELSAGLAIARAGCDLLWVTLLLLCTAVLAATTQRGPNPLPAHYHSPAQLALMSTSLDRPAPGASASGVPPSPNPSSNPSSQDSVIDITAKSSAQLESDLPMYTQDAPVEAHDPTALLRAAILRSFDSPSQQSAFESIRSTLPADFTLALQGYERYTPPLAQGAFQAHGPASHELPAHITPPRPRTAGAVHSLRRTISRLVHPNQRPRTAPSRPQQGEQEDCSTLPSSRLTPPQAFSFESASAAARDQEQQEQQEWVVDLEASPNGQIVQIRRAREQGVDVKMPREGVRVEVETESDAYESAEEGGRKE